MARRIPLVFAAVAICAAPIAWKLRPRPPRTGRGNHIIEAQLQRPAAESAQKLNYRVVASYPHDPEAFLQGLVWTDGKLYESTGLNGKSSLRLLDLKSGKVLRKISLPQQYFGEGLAL